eukprot:scaffold4170_cov63-Phaeocystis_antarctica.AAC.4
MESVSQCTAGSAPAPSPSATRCTPSWPAAPELRRGSGPRALAAPSPACPASSGRPWRGPC